MTVPARPRLNSGAAADGSPPIVVSLATGDALEPCRHCQRQRGRSTESRSEAGDPDSCAHPHRYMPVNCCTHHETTSGPRQDGITTRKHLPKSRRCPKPRPAGEAVGSTVRTEETLTAGAPQMQKLVDIARRTLAVDQKAADAARHDNPKTLSASLDVTESEICAHFIALARERREACEVSLARLQLDRKATAAKIDVKQTRDSFARLLT